jgi:uncharacterized Zn finger protein
MDTIPTTPVADPAPVMCLYCGSADDIHEVLNTIDERTSGYVLRCGACEGTWTR